MIIIFSFHVTSGPITKNVSIFYSFKGESYDSVNNISRFFCNSGKSQRNITSTNVMLIEAKMFKEFILLCCILQTFHATTAVSNPSKPTSLFTKKNSLVTTIPDIDRGKIGILCYTTVVCRKIFTITYFVFCVFS